MVKVAGCWDVMYFPAPAAEFNSRWRFLLQGFRLDGFYMSPITGFAEDHRTPADPREHVIEVADIMDAVAANPELVPVLVDENAPTQLHAFEHPDDALYLFGRTGQSFFAPWEGVSVAIEYPGSMAPYLQPDQAAAIVLYDRMVKAWR